MVARKIGLFPRLTVAGLLVALVVIGVWSTGSAGATTSADGAISLAADATTGAPATDAPADTDAPATEAPDTGDGETGGDSVEIGAVLLIVGVALFLIILLSMLFRGGTKRRGPATTVVNTAPAPAPVPAAPSPATVEWIRRARSSYATTRWVHDTADEKLASWKQVELAADGRVAANDPRHQTWRDVEQRLASGASELYGLESDAPTGMARSAVRETVDGLRGLGTALDNRVRLPVSASTEAAQEAAVALERERGRVARALDGLAEAIRSVS